MKNIQYEQIKPTAKALRGAMEGGATNFGPIDIKRESSMVRNGLHSLKSTEHEVITLWHDGTQVSVMQAATIIYSSEVQ